jgi:hypothetical protein
MKRLRSLFNKSQSSVKHDVLGIYRNVLFVGKQTEFTEIVASRLSGSFNLFYLLGTDMTGEKEKPLFSVPYNPAEPINQEEVMSRLSEIMGEKRKKFDAIVINEDLPFPPNTDIFSDELFDTVNMKKIEDSGVKALLAYRIAKAHLHHYGTVISVVDYQSFESASEDTVGNAMQNQNLHLSFLLADLKSLDYQNRIHTLLYDDPANLSLNNETYKDLVAKALINWINNRRAPDHNAYIHFKYDGQANKLSTIYS